MKCRTAVFRRRDKLVVVSWTGGFANTYCIALPVEVAPQELETAVLDGLAASDVAPQDRGSATPPHARILGFKSWHGFARGAVEVLISTEDGRTFTLRPAIGPDFASLPDRVEVVADPSGEELGSAILALLKSL